MIRQQYRKCGRTQNARALSPKYALDRGTVQGWLKTGRLPTWQQPSGDSTVDVHGDYRRRRWDEGCHNGVRLWRELRERGFTGGASTVRDWLRRLRAANPQPAGSAPA